MDSLEAISIARSVDDIIADVGRSVASRAGTFIMMFSQNSGLVKQCMRSAMLRCLLMNTGTNSNGRADVDGGATLMVQRNFDPLQDKMHLVTLTMNYALVPMRQDGSAAWE
jgi:hypothetical protein